MPQVNDWRPFLSGIGRGKGHLGCTARLLLDKFPSASARVMRIQAERLDDAAKWVERIAAMERVYRAGTTVIVPDKDDWEPLGGGGHVRRIHEVM
jgi:hypothetical protein